MRTAEQWLSDYNQTHQNPVNKRIHFICVPLILWSILALLWLLPTPSAVSDLPYVNWATLLLIIGFSFYARLGLRYFTEMGVVTGAALGVTYLLYAAGAPVGWLAGVIFVLAWIGQFIGHKIEGKKPSFLEDLLFLFVGPLWIIENGFGRRPKL